VIEFDLVKLDFVVKSHNINILRSSKLDVLGILNGVGVDDSVGGDVKVSHADNLSLAGAIEAAAEDSEGSEDHGVRATLNSIERLNSGEMGLPLLELFEDFAKVDDVEGLIGFLLFEMIVYDFIFGVLFSGEEFNVVFTDKLREFTECGEVSRDFLFGGKL